MFVDVDQSAELRMQPVAVFGDEAVAGDQARAFRQRQAHAALAHRKFDPARARIAHAQHFDIATIVQPQRHAVALLAS